MAVKQRIIIRNSLPLAVNIRLGGRRDSYHISLAPRGQRGDTHIIPNDLSDHDAIDRNVKANTIERITKAEYDKLDYDSPDVARLPARPTIVGATGEPVKVGGIMRDSDISTTVGAVDENGNVSRARTVGTVTLGAEISESTNPARVKAPGTTDNPTKEIGVVRRRQN